MPKIRGNVDHTEFIDCDQASAEGRKTTICRVTGLPHEAQPVLTADSPTSSALWHLSLVLREIAENLEPRGDEKQSPRLVPGEDTLTASDEECNDGQKRHGTRSGNKIGRKRYDVPFAIVCKALQACCGNYSAAARWIFEETGIKVSPGFVQTRVQRENQTLEGILGQPLQSLAPKSGQKQLAKEG